MRTAQNDKSVSLVRHVPEQPVESKAGHRLGALTTHVSYCRYYVLTGKLNGHGSVIGTSMGSTILANKKPMPILNTALHAAILMVPHSGAHEDPRDRARTFYPTIHLNLILFLLVLFCSEGLTLTASSLFAPYRGAWLAMSLQFRHCLINNFLQEALFKSAVTTSSSSQSTTS